MRKLFSDNKDEEGIAKYNGGDVADIVFNLCEDIRCLKEDIPPKAKLIFKDGEWWCEYMDTISEGATPKLAYFSCLSKHHEGLESYFQRLWAREAIDIKWGKPDEN